MDSEVGWVLEICRTCWKNLKTRRPDPSEPPSGPPAGPPKAESPLSKPKPVASKPTDVVDATFGDTLTMTMTPTVAIMKRRMVGVTTKTQKRKATRRHHVTRPASPM